MNTDWDIRPRGHECAVCHTPFADKAPYHTELTFTDDGYDRRDLCPLCSTTAAAARNDKVVSVWQGIYKAPAPPPPEPIERNAAETRLRELINSTDPAHAGVRYILAVMLERKKILRHRDTLRQDGQDMLVYEHTSTGETFTLVDPHLRLDQLEAVQQAVVEQLGQASPPAG